jgi:putative PEP-CTERM system TPR-repeat lipoprotein
MVRGFFAWRRGASIAVIALGALVVLTGCEESVERLVAEAGKLLDAGDFPAATIKLKAALAQDPTNIPARLLSAQIYIDLSQGDAALGFLLRAQQDGAGDRDIAKLRAQAALAAGRYADVIKNTEAPPEGVSDAVSASLLAFRAAALAALGRQADARAALERGLVLDPRSLDVRLAEARWAIGNGDFDTARRELAAATRDAPKDRRLLRIQGDIAYSAKDFPAAEEAYRKIVDAEPWNELARGALAAAQIAEDKLPQAIASLNSVLNDARLADVPKHPILHYMRALAAFRMKDFTAAQSNAENVVARIPDYEPARLIAGASSYALHEYERAYYYMSPYLSQNPKDIQARKLMAAIQLQLSRPGDAAKTLSPVSDKATEDQDLLRLIGVAAARSGDAATANQYLKRALDRQPDDWALRAELGVADIAAGDPKAGIDNLEQVVKAHPDESRAEIPLFTALMQTKEYDKALAIADQMNKGEPKSPTGELLAAVVYLAQGNRDAGRAALLKAREIRPGDVGANNNLARLALADGKADEARLYYRDILAANPQNARTYIALADLDTRTGRLQEAEDALLKGIEANPTDPVIVVALFRLQLARGGAQQAAAGGLQALKKFPQNPALLDIVGRAELAAGQREEALTTFKDLVGIAHDAAWAHTDLAEAYLSKYTPDTPQWPAINEATEAVRLDPHDRAAKLVLARALIAHSRFAEASEVVDALRAANKPVDVDVAELEGLAAQGQSRLADAAAAFTRAVTLGDNAVDRRRLADIQMRLGHPDDAGKTLRTWLGAHPEDNQTRRVWADICVKDGQLGEAGDQYAELVRRVPEDPALRNNLAWILSQLGKGDEALGQARAAVALAPESADFLDTLGTIMLHSGNPTEAVDPLEKAWEKHPERLNVGFHLSEALAAAHKKDEAVALLRRLLAGNDPFAERSQAQELLRQIGG